MGETKSVFNESIMSFLERHTAEGFRVHEWNIPTLI